MKNDDKVKDMLTEEKIPRELEPDSIKEMLDKKAPARKRKNIHMAARITAGAAACAVICGTALHFAGENDKFKDKDVISSEYEKVTTQIQEVDVPQGEDVPTLVSQAPYMSGAKDYSEVYQLYRTSYKTRYSKYKYSYATNGDMTDMAVGEAAEEDNEDESVQYAAPTPKTEGGADEEPDEPEFSDTYNQEEGVLEADIAKTDGKNIYFVYDKYDDSYNANAWLNSAAVEDGKFIYSEKVALDPDIDVIFGEGYEKNNVSVEDMYVYNGTVAVIGTVDGTKKEPNPDYVENEDTSDYEYIDIGEDCFYQPKTLYYNKSATFVMLFTTGDSPQLIDTYYQEGSYNDVRISPDGYMYLITDYFTQDLSWLSEGDLNDFVPSKGMSGSVELISPDEILMPADEEAEYNIGGTVVGSLDMNTSGSAVPVDSKVLAGYTGNVYSSADNIYTAVGWDDTDITRISVSAGNIVPAASGRVEGRIKDQFSMSEYNGYFRIATTKDNYREIYDHDESENDGFFYSERDGRDNRIYVLDLDLNEVGSIKGFGKDEEIKSVNYAGDIAYVVTYVQTDPLFAIDLSDPTSPVMLDEFKLPGYSTYMQKWDDGLLFGFGVNADENGWETGIRLNMFDNSDPSDLKLADSYEINQDEDTEYYSLGCWDRKATLIAPEKDLIAVEVVKETSIVIESGEGEEHYSYTTYGNPETGYWFFSFEDGKFVLKGQFSEPMSDYSESMAYQRAMYIGDYVYILSGARFTAISIDDFTVTDQADFT